MQGGVRRDPGRRVLHVLRTIAELPDRDWGVRELARTLHLSPSTAHRLLATLQSEGLIDEDDGSRRYRLGLEFFRLARRTSSWFPFAKEALPTMQDLVAGCNETVLLGLYDGNRTEMQFVASVDSSHPLRYVVELYKWLPVYVGASGLAIMAFLPENERRAIVARTRLKPVTELTITDPRELEQEIAKIRRRGYAFTRGQRTPGAVGIAAPIWGPEGRVVGDLVLTIPEQRFNPRSESKLVALIIDHAQRVTDELNTSRVGGPDRKKSGQAIGSRMPLDQRS